MLKEHSEWCSEQQATQEKAEALVNEAALLCQDLKADYPQGWDLVVGLWRETADTNQSAEQVAAEMRAEMLAEIRLARRRAAYARLTK